MDQFQNDDCPDGRSRLFINAEWYDRLKIYVNDMGRVLELFKDNIQHDPGLAEWILQCNMIIYDEGSLFTSFKFTRLNSYSYIRAILSNNIEILSQPSDLGLAVFYNANMLGASLQCRELNGAPFTVGIISKSNYHYPNLIPQ